MTHSSPSRTARVRIPATSEPASGSVMPRQEIFVARDRRHEVALLLLLGAEQVDRRRRHVRVHRDAHREAAGVGVRHLLGEHEVAEVVAALAAVLLGVGEPEQPELAHAREDRVGERRLLPLLRVRARARVTHEGVDRLAQPVVLLGEDEVPPAGGEVGLEDVGGRGAHESGQ